MRTPGVSGRPWRRHLALRQFFFFNDTATTEIYTLSLHDALPISLAQDPARHLRGVERLERLRLLPDADVLDRRADRKSTRLNSSHSQISYAVFCLKKKKTNYNRDNDR